MAVTAADVKALATELAAVADATVTTWIAIAERRTSETAWGGKYDDGITFLAAHYVTISTVANAGASGSVGATSSRRVGDVATTMLSTAASAGSIGDDVLRSTVWGQLYLDLKSTIFADRVV